MFVNIIYGFLLSIFQASRWIIKNKIPSPLMVPQLRMLPPFIHELYSLIFKFLTYPKIFREFLKTSSV